MCVAVASEAVTATEAAPGVDDRREVARGGVLSMAGSAYAAVLGFVLYLAVGRLFGAEISGIYFQAIAIYMILNGLALLGSDTGLVRTLARHRAVGSHARAWAAVKVTTLPVLCWSVIVSLSLFFASGRFATAISPGDPARARAYLLTLSVTLLISAVGHAHLCGTRSLGTLKPYVALYQFWLPTSRVLGVALIAVLDVDPDWLLWGWALPMVLMDVAAVSYVIARSRRAALEDPGPAPKRAVEIARDEWRFNVPRGISVMFELALTWIDVIIVGILLGPAVAGAYGVASRFMTSGTMAMEALRLGTAPMIAAAFARGEKQRVQDIYATSSVWLVLLSWPIFLTLATFAPFVLGLLGRDFLVAAPAMTLMSLAILGYIAMGNIVSVILMAGNSTGVLLVAICSLVINVTLNLVLVPRIGLIGASIAWSTAMTFDSAMGLFVLSRFVVGGMTPPVRLVGLAGGLALLAWGATGLVVRLAGEQNLFWLLGYGILALSLYAVLVRTFRTPLGLDDFAAMMKRRQEIA